MKVDRNLTYKLLIGLAGIAFLAILGGCGTPPRIPEKPTGPVQAPKGAPRSYSTRTTDPNALPIYYQFDWGDRASSAWRGPFPGDSAISDTHSFGSTGPMLVRARAKNTKNATSNWSDTLHVSVIAGDSTRRWLFQAKDPEDPEAILPFRGSVAASRDGGMLCAASDMGYLHFFDVNGSRRANAFLTTDQEDFANSPSVAKDNRVLIGSDQSQYAILFTGSLSWAVGIVPERGLAATDDSGHIFFNGDDGMLHALTASGTALWPPQHTGGGPASPAITADGSLVIIGGDDSLVHAFNAATGETAWTVRTGDVVDGSPAIASDGKIIIGSDDGMLRAIKPTGGDPTWTYAANSPISTSPVIGQDEVIYVVSSNGVLHAVNADGTGKWSMPLNCADVSSGAITASGILYLTANFGGEDSLIAIETSPVPATRFWGVAVPDMTVSDVECSPLIGADGAVYVTSNESDLGGVYCFWGKDGPASSSWPMFQHDASRSGKASQ